MGAAGLDFCTCKALPLRRKAQVYIRKCLYLLRCTKVEQNSRVYAPKWGIWGIYDTIKNLILTGPKLYFLSCHKKFNLDRPEVAAYAEAAQVLDF